MTCRQAEPLLARAAEGTLDADRGAALARHLAACAGCRAALDAQRAVRGLLAARPETPAPAGFAARVLANLPETGRRAAARPAERNPAAAAGWLDAVNWQAWTLRLAPVAGALFVAAAVGLGSSADAAGTGASDPADVAAAWMAEETPDGEFDFAPGDPGAPEAAWMAEEPPDGETAAPVDALARLWRDAGETADDLLLDVLLAADPEAAPAGASEAGR